MNILFFNVNGSGMGHLNRCLAYARRLDGRARPFFFSLASAMEIIEQMGFAGDYFVSHYWSASSSFAWNSELAVRFGLMLEHVQPAAVVFDGTWPFQGLLAACRAYRGEPPALVWSNRGLLKADVAEVPVDESLFDLVLLPGELGAGAAVLTGAHGKRRLQVPPVCLLDETELLDRDAARAALGLSPDGRYALFSLGPGNLKDVSGIGQGLIRAFVSEGFQVVWAQPPISIRDMPLPDGVMPLAVYPLARYLRGFDAFVGAAGYNTCCEVVQAAIPALLVPNAHLADDQLRRALLVADFGSAVVSACETQEQQLAAVQALLALMSDESRRPATIAMNGAALAAEAIFAAIKERRP